MISPIAHRGSPLLASMTPSAPAPSVGVVGGEGEKLRETFDQFVGQTFFGQLIGSMRDTVGKPAYFHGGRAEEIFRSHLDQTLAAEMTERSAADLTGPMFELFSLSRS